MTDEAHQRGNRSLETADYLSAAGFAAKSGFPAHSDFPDDEFDDDSTSFSEGSVRFSHPATESPAAPDFSLTSSDFSARYESTAEFAFSAEPEGSAEPEDAAELEDAAEPEDAIELEEPVETEETVEADETVEAEDSFEAAPFEREASAEDEDPYEPEASAEPAAWTEPASAEPETTAEPEEPDDSEATAGLDHSAEPAASAGAEETPAEPAYRARPPFTDVFTRPSFFDKRESLAEPEPPAEPESLAEPEASAEPASSAEHEYRPGSAYSGLPAEPQFRPRPSYSDLSAESGYRSRSGYPGLSTESGYRADSSSSGYSSEASAQSHQARSGYSADAFARPDYRSRSGYSPDISAEPDYRTRPEQPNFFSRPAFFPKPEASEEDKLAQERRFSGPEQERFSPFPVETRFGTEPAQELAGRAGVYESSSGAEATVRPPESSAEPVTETEAQAQEPSVTVEVPGKPTAQHPVRTTGELSVLRAPAPPAGVDARLPDGLWAYEAYPVAENVPPADDQAGLVSLGYIGGAFKRKKKIWVTTTALGVLVAGGLYATYHATYTDTTTVMLALDPSLDATTAIQTDAVLATDSTMAQLTMQKLGMHETVPEFLKTYTVAVSTTTDNLLTFTATAASATAAYNEANTLANTYLQYRAQTELEKESANTAAQDQQVTQTQQTINSLNSQIRTLKADGASSTDSRLTRLENELTTAQNLLTSLQQTVASADATERSTTAQLIAGSSVISPGIPAEGRSKTKFALAYGAGAIFGGLVLGLLIVAIGAIVSDRLRRRDDVAAALGAPVRVSVASGGGKRSRKAWQEADLKRVAAHLRGAVPSGSDGAGSLVVVAVDDKTFVSEAIREVAVTAAREGKRVVVADLAGGALGRVFGTKEPGIRGVDMDGTRVVLVTPDRGDLAPVGPLPAPMLGTPMNGIQNVHSAADVFITLAAVDPATGAAHLKTWSDDAVAVVTAGESSVAKVQAVGEMIRFAGARLISAVLLGADEKDESLGFVSA